MPSIQVQPITRPEKKYLVIMSKVVVLTVTSLLMTKGERLSLISPRHQLTILMNAKRTIAHILGLDLGSEILSPLIRVTFYRHLFDGATDAQLSKWFTLRLSNYLD